MMFAVFDVFASYSSALHTSLVRTQGFSLMVTTHNFTALRTNGMTKDILIFNSFRPKNFLYLVIRHKKGLYLSPQFFWFFFRLLTYINPNILMGAKQWRRALLLLRPFEPFSFYTRHTTQKIYHHHHHHPSDHHHSHNSHHTTYIPNPL